MIAEAGAGASPEFDALHTAALLAVDPVGLGGAVLRTPAGLARDEWLAAMRALLPVDTPWRRVPFGIADDRLLGGLDLAATLAAGRPVAQRGVLAEADGGVAVLPMAERLGADTAARLALVLDQGEVSVHREGLSLTRPARVAMIALDEGRDEGAEDGERTPAALRERLAFAPSLVRRSPRDGPLPVPWTRDDVLAARAALPQVRCSEEIVQALCAAALALGVDSVRAPLQAVRAARAATALAGRTEVEAEDAALAARLVLAPRATRLPAPPEEPEPESPPPESAEPPPDSDSETDVPLEPDALEDRVLEAAKAAIPPGLLAALLSGAAMRSAQSAGGKSGATKKSGRRGRPAGVRRGEPRAGLRLNLIATLRTAAPWQPLRRREALERTAPSGPGDTTRIHVRREDFHVTRYKQHTETTTLFVVDASGSSALHRLAEAKGAVELLLADCYVRRDRVAVIGFRGATAELLLPPTRSLVRAKKSLAGLPGGGGTPLAAAIDSAAALAEAVRRQGATPLVVLLTDGRANIARDGKPGRPQAQADALASAARLRAAGIGTLLLDTSPQPQPAAQQLALTLGARYLPLPYADARTMSSAVQQAARDVAAGA